LIAVPHLHCAWFPDRLDANRHAEGENSIRARIGYAGIARIFTKTNRKE